MLKRKARQEENTCRPQSNKGLVSGIHEKFTKFNGKNQVIQLENGQKIWTCISPKTIYNGPNKHMKRCSTS